MLSKCQSTVNKKTESVVLVAMKRLALSLVAALLAGCSSRLPDGYLALALELDRLP